MGYQGILFDLDGTLIDTAVDMIEALATLAQNHHIKHNLNTTDYRQYISKGAVALVKSVFNDPSAGELKILRQEYLEIYQQQLNTQSHLFDGIATLLNHLDITNTPWGIVTNKPSWLASPIVKSLKQLASCQVLICADQVGISKPHPKPIQVAMDQMNLEHKTTLYLGDAESDIQAANQAGIASAIALWGYLAPEDRPNQWAAKHQFLQPQQLIALFS